MTTYVAFLRAINLGAKRKFPKERIVAATAAAGFDDVATHINTGNVRVGTRMRSRRAIEAKLETAYLAETGFDVPTIAFSAAELRAVAADAEELTSPELERHYLYLLKDEPNGPTVAAMEAASDATNRIVVRGRAAHVLLGPGYQQGGVDPFRVEKGLATVATNRNLNVVRTVVEKWC